ncbi:MAG TPA: hypothetical protein VNC82_15405 [Candidatus Limnocylindria bacterium]|nr:hypothetical protein [Candidatus Limnocylindria bacterium]
MRHRSFLPLMLGVVLLSAGCAATHREWEVWRAHPTHYATGNHMTFSMGNVVGGAPRVTPEMVEQARSEKWWGRNTPFVGPRADVAGRWEGTWSGYGIWRSLRGGVAEAVLTLDGATGHGVLVLKDSQVAEGVPLAVRERSSFGAPIEISVSETDMWVNGTERGRPFAASFRLQGDRLVGGFLYTNSPVRIELTRIP